MNEEDTKSEPLATKVHAAHEAPSEASRRLQEGDVTCVAAGPPPHVGVFAVCENSGLGPRGWVFYDGECRFCVRGARQWGGFFARRGFHWLPLQTAGATARLGMTEVALREEMKLLHADGRIVGGVEAWAVLFRSVWWLWPIGALLGLPGARWFGGVGYRWVARNRNCLSGDCELNNTHPFDQSRKHRRPGTFFERS